MTTIDDCREWLEDSANRDSLQSGMCIRFLLAEVEKVRLTTARECMDEALQFTGKGYHPEKRGTATQIAACIRVRFNI